MWDPELRDFALARSGAEVAVVSLVVVSLWLCCAGLVLHGVFLPQIRSVMVVMM